jgi:hypothetical protein
MLARIFCSSVGAAVVVVAASVVVVAIVVAAGADVVLTTGTSVDLGDDDELDEQPVASELIARKAALNTNGRSSIGVPDG